MGKLLFYRSLFYIFSAVFCTASLAAQSVDASLDENELIPASRIFSAPLSPPSEGFTLNFFENLRPVQETPHETIVSFGFSSSPRLFSIELENSTSQPLNRLLVADPTWIDQIQITLNSPDGTNQIFYLGDRRPVSARSIHHQNSNVFLTLQPGTSRLFIWAQTVDPFLLQIKLCSSNAFYVYDRMLMLYNGFLYGILIAMLLYNLFVYISIRENVYAAYVNYIIFFIFLYSTCNGHLFAILWPDSPTWNNWAHSISLYFYIGSGLLFLVQFLELRKRFPFYFRLTSLFAILLSFSFLITAAGGFTYHVRSAVFWVILYTPFVIFIGFKTFLEGNLASRYFLTAAIAGFIGSLLSALTLLGFMPYNFFTYHLIDLGMILDAILLSFALADRVRIARNEADKAKADLLDYTRKYARNLEEEITARTRDLQDANRKLFEQSNQDSLTISHGYSVASDSVTISIGCACMIPDEKKQSEDLILSADEALYRAKNGGRNRIVGLES